jgi:hypothetical protein
MNEIILVRPEPIDALPSPEVIVKHETNEDPDSVKEEDHDS